MEKYGMSIASNATTLAFKEEILTLPSAQLAVQYCGDADKPLLVFLHGWLDNSASFHLLAEELLGKNLLEDYQLLLVDLPGHGLSQPLADGAHYYIWQNIETLFELMSELNLERINLIGHSMGGVVASLFAGTFADKVESLILLDSLGPMASSAEQTPAQLNKAIKDSQRIGSGLRVYPELVDALSARKKSSPAMSDQALLPIVNRNLIAVEGGYSWRTDKRLKQTSKVRLTEDQVMAFFSSITAKVMVILAKEGIVPKTWQDNRLQAIKNHKMVTLPGHHHFHCEAEFVSEIAKEICTFHNQ
jgi:pimeloyl-ACP methyl ester carboxylesterase